MQFFNQYTFIFLLNFVVGIPPPERCVRHYEKIGCYNDQGSDRGLPEFLLTHRSTSGGKSDGHQLDWANWPESIHALACKCASLARERGFKYFGLQFYGECWAGSSNTYDKHGQSSQCVGHDYSPCVKVDDTECVGKASKNYVYRLLSEDYPQLSGFEQPRQNVNPCPDSLCDGKSDGHYQFTTFSHANVSSITKNGGAYFDYYFTCNATIAHCVPCPLNTYYHQQCDQCLDASRIGESQPCFTKPVHGSAVVVQNICPLEGDAFTSTQCAQKAANFRGNIIDARNNTARVPTTYYIVCWDGIYVACMACPTGLIFNELKNWQNQFDRNGHCGYPS